MLTFAIGAILTVAVFLETEILPAASQALTVVVGCSSSNNSIGKAGYCTRPNVCNVSIDFCNRKHLYCQ